MYICIYINTKQSKNITNKIFYFYTCMILKNILLNIHYVNYMYTQRFSVYLLYIYKQFIDI